MCFGLSSQALRNAAFSGGMFRRAVLRTTRSSSTGSAMAPASSWSYADASGCRRGSCPGDGECQPAQAADASALAAEPSGDGSGAAGKQACVPTDRAFVARGGGSGHSPSAATRVAVSSAASNRADRPARLTLACDFAPRRRFRRRCCGRRLRAGIDLRRLVAERSLLRPDVTARPRRAHHVLPDRRPAHDPARAGEQVGLEVRGGEQRVERRRDAVLRGRGRGRDFPPLASRLRPHGSGLHAAGDARLPRKLWLAEGRRLESLIRADRLVM